MPFLQETVTLVQLYMKTNSDPQFSHFSQNEEYTGQNMLIMFWSTLALSFQNSAAIRISYNYL